MDNETYDQFFNALHKIVDEDVDWTTKMKQFNNYLGDREKVALDELMSWLEDA